MMSYIRRILAILIALVLFMIGIYCNYEWTNIALVEGVQSRKHISVQSEVRKQEVDRSYVQQIDKMTPLEYFSRVLHGSGSFLEDDSQREFNRTKLKRTNCTRQVQIWGSDIYNIRPQGIEPCPGINCGIKLVIDTSYETLKSSHAVLLFHVSQWNWAELISHKPKGQKWIFFSHESPLNTRKDIVPPNEYYSRAYDYHMSFRFREFQQLYGSYGYYDTSKPAVSLNDTRNWAAGRKRKVVWVASNCKGGYLHWNRTGFVKKLSKLVDVGMYGKCGEQGACPSRHEKIGENDYYSTCSELLRQFKFYLALENCACRDYITEKFWNNAYEQDLIPIVFGPSRANYETVAPPNSFIHVEDFETLQDLANYINILDRNDHLYNKFFEWKKYGSVVNSREEWLFQPRNMCQVVHRMLAEKKAERDGKTILPTHYNLTEWWTNSCRKLPEFPIKMTN